MLDRLIDKDLLVAARKVISKRLAKLRRLYIDYSPHGKKYDELAEQCDGDFDQISWNLFVIKTEIDTLEQKYNSTVRRVAEKMTEKRRRRRYNNRVTPWLTAPQKLEQRRLEEQSKAFQKMLYEEQFEEMPEFNFDL